MKKTKPILLVLLAGAAFGGYKYHQPNVSKLIDAKMTSKELTLKTVKGGDTTTAVYPVLKRSTNALDDPIAKQAEFRLRIRDNFDPKNIQKIELQKISKNRFSSKEFFLVDTAEMSKPAYKNLKGFFYDRLASGEDCEYLHNIYLGPKQ